MKKTILIALAAILSLASCSAQAQPQRGPGQRNNELNAYSGEFSGRINTPDGKKKVYYLDDGRLDGVVVDTKERKNRYHEYTLVSVNGEKCSKKLKYVDRNITVMSRHGRGSHSVSPVYMVKHKGKVYFFDYKSGMRPNGNGRPNHRHPHHPGPRK